ncbi:MAG: zf-HC2 domain-containing protein [Armatimonadetes bacterium]|nr:zf-HC2 domain-containing protein [Armatimonadota bacterium]
MPEHATETEHQQHGELSLSADGGLDALERALFLDPAGTDHLSYERMASFVDGEADAAERRRIILHTGACEPCRSDLAALAEVVVMEPLTSAAAPDPGASVLSRAGRLLAGLRVPPRLTFAVCCAVILAAAVGWRQERLRADRADMATVLLRRDLAQARGGPAPAVGPERSLADGAVLVEDAGGKIAATGDGSLVRVQSLPIEVARAVRTGHLTPSSAALSALAQLGSSAPVTLGPEHSAPPVIRLTAPVACITASATPTLQWRRPAGATRHEIQLTDQTTGTELPACSVGPSDRRRVASPLVRGHVYSWQVTAFAGSRVIGRSWAEGYPPARFRVLDAPTAAKLDANAGSTLSMAVLYAEAGLLDEARERLERLKRANPSSRLPRKMLAGLAESELAVARSRRAPRP